MSKAFTVLYETLEIMIENVISNTDYTQDEIDSKLEIFEEEFLAKAKSKMTYPELVCITSRITEAYQIRFGSEAN